MVGKLEGGYGRGRGCEADDEQPDFGGKSGDMDTHFGWLDGGGHEGLAINASMRHAAATLQY